ncbi:MAG: hypothetical protein WDO68_10685 [Gammaproteobacteria bacterium]
MNDQRALQILHSLVQGADPFTGAELSGGTVLQNGDVIRALLTGLNAVKERVTRAGRRAALPRNIGRAWTPEEQERLVEAFKNKENLEEVAVKHGRTVRAIEARLELIGMITAQERTTQDRFGAGQSDGRHHTGGRKRRARTSAS